MTLADMTLRQYIKKAEDKTSVPGGGSVSALCGALSASLAIMVLKLSEAPEAACDNFKGPSKAMVDNIDDDSTSFDGVLQAFKLPKETEEERLIRTKAIEEAYIHAIEVPLNTMQNAARIMSLIQKNLPNIKNTAISDIYIAADLCQCAFNGAKYTANLNISALKNREGQKEYKNRMAKLEEKIYVDYEQIMEHIE